MTRRPSIVGRLLRGIGLLAVLLGLVAMHQLIGPAMPGQAAMPAEQAMSVGQAMSAHHSAAAIADRAAAGMCAHEPCVATLNGTVRPPLPGAVLDAAAPASMPRPPAIRLLGPASRAPPAPSLTSLCVWRT